MFPQTHLRLLLVTHGYAQLRGPTQWVAEGDLMRVASDYRGRETHLKSAG